MIDGFNSVRSYKLTAKFGRKLRKEYQEDGTVASELLTIVKKATEHQLERIESNETILREVLERELDNLVECTAHMTKMYAMVQEEVWLVSCLSIKRRLMLILNRYWLCSQNYTRCLKL